MMTETNTFDSCDGSNDYPFCNRETKLAVLMKRKRSTYDYNRDCDYDYNSCKSEPMPEACVFSPSNIEVWEHEGEKDIHTSDYLEKDVE